MHALLSCPFYIGRLQLPHRLLQGPLAGFSCAPFRISYNQFLAPAYCVTEMISALDVLHKHSLTSRYLVRLPEEKLLCYQLAGTSPSIMADAAKKLQALGADLIDVNAGCPKPKIRKKGAGSALLDNLDNLQRIISAMREAIEIPLTVKLRICGDERDMMLAQAIERAGADALIIHGRRWTDDYDVPCNFHIISKIKQAVQIPVIANGDISSKESLLDAIKQSGCDAYMISRSGTGQPWLYRQLLQQDMDVTNDMRIDCFISHLHGLAALENEYKAVLQSKSLARYYFKNKWRAEQFSKFYGLVRIIDIQRFLTG